PAGAGAASEVSARRRARAVAADAESREHAVMGNDADLLSLKAQLDALRGRPPADVPSAAVALAEGMQRLANAWTSAAERKDQARLARLMEDRDGRLLTTALTDRALRPRLPARVADQLRYLLGHFGIPRYFPWLDRQLLRAFRL